MHKPPIFNNRRRVPRAQVANRYRSVRFQSPELDSGFFRVVEVAELGIGVEYEGRLHPTQMGTIHEGVLKVGFTTIPVCFRVVYRKKGMLGIEFTSFRGDENFLRGFIRYIFRHELAMPASAVNPDLDEETLKGKSARKDKEGTRAA